MKTQSMLQTHTRSWDAIKIRNVWYFFGGTPLIEHPRPAQGYAYIVKAYSDDHVNKTFGFLHSLSTDSS